MNNKEGYIILNLGLGVKDIVKVTTMPTNTSNRYMRVQICNYPKSQNVEVKDYLISPPEILLVNKKYLFDSIEEALNYLEDEV